MDKDFLKKLDLDHNKVIYVKLVVLDKEEQPISSIEGRVSQGSISITGTSAVRRTCNLTFLAEETENDLTDIDNLLSIEKRVAIYVGQKNNVDSSYDDIVWFPKGIFLITQPNISHTLTGVTISLSCQDKMCLLNGTSGGGLPTSITFHEYDQLMEDGSIEAIPQRMYDIVLTLVHNYGGIPLSKIIINDLPLQIKQIVRYIGNDTLYYNPSTGVYTTNTNLLTDPGEWKGFDFNDDVGYVYTDFVYPGKLVSNIGDNVCSVLDKVCKALGNFEYFFDEQGNFIFQEIKNYLNNSYDPTDAYRLDNNRKVELNENGLCIMDGTNYKLDTKTNTKSVYTFDGDVDLVVSYSNAPKYSNIKNDFHVWGKNDKETCIHYHMAIKKKPSIMNTYKVVFLKDDDGEYTGRLRLAEDGEIIPNNSHFDGDKAIISGGTIRGDIAVLPSDYSGYDGTAATITSAIASNYTPSDWRAELYLQGLTKKKEHIRPDVYEQELLDLFDDIYDFKQKKFKADIVNKPNELNYFFDYLEPSEELYDCSIDAIDARVYSYQQDKIKRLYNTDIPDTIIINIADDVEKRRKIIDRCELEGQSYSNVSEALYKDLAECTYGYTAQETMRDLLYQYTNYNESITISCIPIYHLDVNTRITVEDRASGIYGDYIINSITLPLGSGTMSINASRALERI